jgi:hypothetical protein
MKVDPERYLEHLRVAHNLLALTYEGVYSVNVALLDQIAEETIRGSMRIDAAEGAGLGMGGMLTIIPDLGILAAITIRMIQKLSLIYGFSYNIDQEEAEPWVAAAPPTERPQHARPRAFYYDGVDPSRHAIRPGVRKRKSISARRDP